MDILFLPTVSGASEQFRLYGPDDPDDGFPPELEPTKQFDALSRRVGHAWVEQPRGARKAGRDRWLERLVYDFFHSHFASAHSESDLKKLFRKRIKLHGRGTRGVKVSSNPFAMALLALFAHEPRGPSPQRRHDMSVLLLAAYRHYVPPALLQGFDTQTGAAGRGRLANDTRLEPGFEDWVVQQRTIERLFRQDAHQRGAYGKSIRARVKALILAAKPTHDDQCRGSTLFAELASEGLNRGR